MQHGSSFRIILVFDAHKLDISDEFKHAIEAIRSQDDKIRIILNKADMMTHQQLMRVYGALMWSLSKILGNPEVKELVHGGDGSNMHLRSLECTLEVSGANLFDMLPIESCLRPNRFSHLSSSAIQASLFRSISSVTFKGCPDFPQ